MLKFALSTGLSATISFGLPVALIEIFCMKHGRAVAIGFFGAYILNIFLIRGFVFASQSHWVRDIVIYVVTNGAFRVLEFVAYVLMVEWVHIHYAIALFSVLGLSALAKFFTYRRIFSGSQRISNDRLDLQ